MEKSRTIIINAHDYVSEQITNKIGFNVRIASVRHDGKDSIFTLKALLPYKLTLTNGITFDGCLEVHNVTTITLTQKGYGYVLKKGVDLKLLDKTLEKRVKDFKNTCNIANIQFDGDKA